MAIDPGKPDKKHQADETQLKSIVSGLVGLKADAFITDKTERHAELEVDSTKGLGVKIVTKGQPPLEIFIGKSAKSGGAYVREAKSNSVFATTSSVVYQLKKNANGFRKKNIDVASVADMTGLSISHPDVSTLQLKKGDDDAWQLISPAPKGFRFDGAVAQRIASQVASLSAQDFAENETIDVKQAVAIAVDSKEGKRVLLTLGPKRSDNTYLLQREGDAQIYVVGQWQAEQLMKKLEDFRNMSLFDFDIEKASKLSIDVGGKKTVVSKGESAWNLVTPKVMPAGSEFDSNQVVRQLSRLKALRAQKIAPGVGIAKAGISKPSGTVEIELADKTKQILRLGLTETGATTSTAGVYVQGAMDDLLYVLASHEKSQFEAGVQLFNKPPPPPANLDHMQGLDQLPPDVRRQLEAQIRQQQMQRR